MKILTSILIALAMGTTNLIAGDNHSHDGHHGHSHAISPVDKTTAEKNAVNVLASFLEKEVIDKSWKDIEVDSSYTKEFHGKEEWVVTFKNDKVKDVKKQTLFIFLTIGGKYIAANFTGE